MNDPVRDHSTFSKNRDRLPQGDIAAEFLAILLDRPPVRRLLSSEQFSVDGTLIQAPGRLLTPAASRLDRLAC